MLDIKTINNFKFITNFTETKCLFLQAYKYNIKCQVFSVLFLYYER